MIGSGKSFVLDVLKKEGEFTVSADAVNAEMLADKDYQKKLKELFPDAVRCGKVNRQKIKAAIVADEGKRQALNALSHDEIFARMQQKASKVTRAFFEVPMLDEDRIAMFDEVWYVECNREERLRRIVERDGVDEQVALHFINVQSPYEGIKKRANAIIHNDGSTDVTAEVRKQLIRVRQNG